MHITNVYIRNCVQVFVFIHISLCDCSIYSVLECLTTQDVKGETALHSTATSKASGFARFYAKLLMNGTQVLQQSTDSVLQLLDLKYNKVTI